ncbi:MAG: hypothetical protein PHQ75_15020 [Thermoguttaceae bacterium]|nr:hypothetical protein [Thermoguttaceae bacterium]
MRRIIFMIVAVCFCVASGCDTSVTIDTPSTPSPQPAAAAKAEQAPAPQPQEIIKKADVGVTGKGQFADSAEKPGAIITVPLATYFVAQEMAVFRIQIPEALKLYNATNGHYPETQEEFMQQIVQANNIVLPKLKEGDSYFYDVKTATLMVRSKR